MHPSGYAPGRLQRCPGHEGLHALAGYAKGHPRRSKTCASCHHSCSGGEWVQLVGVCGSMMLLLARGLCARPQAFNIQPWRSAITCPLVGGSESLVGDQVGRPRGADPITATRKCGNQGIHAIMVGQGACADRGGRILEAGWRHVGGGVLGSCPGRSSLRGPNDHAGGMP